MRTFHKSASLIGSPTLWCAARTRARTARLRDAAGRAGCESTRKQRVTRENVRRCTEEGRDKDGRGGGLAMPYGHLHGRRAAHHHVRQQRDRARREGEWEKAEVDGSCGGRSREFLSFSIVLHMGSKENMPIHSLSDSIPIYEG